MSDIRDQAISEIRAELSELDLDWAEPAPGLFSVSLPGTRKLVTECALQVAKYGMNVRAFVARNPDENHAGVYRWLLEVAEFRDLYARAREDQADTLADEIVAIADEPPVIVTSGDGEEVEVALDSAAIARQRLRIDARKWVASKLKPKRYGEKIDLEHGSDPDRPMIQKVINEIVRPPNTDG